VKHALECIAIPITHRELPELKALLSIWKKHFASSASDSSSHIDLLITLSGRYSREIESKILEILVYAEVYSFFNRVRMEFIGISKEEDIYLRQGEVFHGSMPRLGLKNGPNHQFFATMKLCREYNTTLLCETDLYPLVPSWIDDLSREISESDHFLVLGSRYKGNHKIRFDYLWHLNGNACYATGHNGFRYGLLAYWERSLAQTCGDEDPSMAYDVWLSSYLTKALFNDEQPRCNDNEIREVARYFYLHRESKLFWNASLPADALTLDQIKALQTIGVALLHGRVHKEAVLRLLFN
jgi:hypothetical protein